MEANNDRKEALRLRIENVLKNKKFDAEALSNKTLEEILEEVSIYHQELEYQNIELQRITHELELSRQHFAELYNDAPVAYALIDESLCLLSINKAFNALLNISENETKNQNIGRYIHPGFQDQFYLYARALMKSKTAKSLELKLNCEKEDIFVKVDGHITTGNGKPLIRISLTDISDRVYFERKQNEIHQLHKTTVQSIGEGVITTNLRGAILQMNPMAEKLSGMPETDTTGKNIDSVFTLFYEGDSDKATFSITKSIAQEQDFRIEKELYLQKQEGKKIPVFVNVSPIFGANKDPVGAVVIVYDRTKERDMERLQEIRIRLFEYAMSHDLQSLLQKTLDEIEALTSSHIGFYHFVADDEKSIILQAWSTKTATKFCKADGHGLHYNVDQAGVWVDCIRLREPIIHNDYNALPHKKGMPEGHAPVIRELVVPIIRKEKIVAVLGIGNKPTDYTQHDVDIVNYFADLAWVIAEKKYADELAEMSSRKITEIISSISEAFIALDNDLTIIYFNTEAEKVLNVRAQEVLNKNVNKAFPASVGSIFEENFTEALSKNQPLTFEAFFDIEPYKNWYEVRIYPSLSGTSIFFKVITDKKMAEEKIRFQANLLSSVTDSVIATNNEGKIIYWNQAASDLYGWTEDEAIGQNVVDMTTPMQTASQANEIMETLKSGKSWSGEFGVKHKNGSVFHAFVSNSPIFGENGTMKGIIGISRDITQKKRLEETLIKSEAKLRLQNDEYNAINLELKEKNEELQNALTLLQSEKNEKQLILDSISDMVVYHDLDMNVQWANKNAQENATCNKEQIKGNRCYNCFGNGESYCPGCPVFTAMETKKGTEAEIVKDNNKIWSVKAFPVFDHSKEVVGVVETMRDITEERLSQEKIRESEERFRVMFESSRDAILTLDPQTGTFVAANQTWFEMLQVSDRNSLVNLTPWDISPQFQPNGERSETFAQKMIAEAVEKGVADFEWQHRRTNGEVFDAHILLAEMVFDGKVMIMSTVRDISERKRAERALNESHKFLDSLLKTIPVPVFYKDSNGKYTGMNRAFEEFVGMKKETLLGKTVFDVHPKELAEKYHEADRRLLERSSFQQYQATIKTAKGEIRDVIFHKATLLDTGNNIAGIVGAFIDITEKEQQNQELQKLLHELQERNKELHCLYEVSKLIEESELEFDELIQKITETLPPAFLHPTTACARISIDNKKYTSFGFVETAHFIKADIVASKKKMGTLEVYCSEPYHEDHDFLEEEKLLIHAIAERLGRFYENRVAEVHLQTLAEMLDHAPNSITVHDFSGNFLYVNQKCLEQHGYIREEFLNLTIDQLDVPESAQLIKERVTKIAENGESSFEVQHFCKDGSKIPLLIFVKTVEWHGKPAMLSIGTDITERKAFEEKLLFQSMLLDQITDVITATDLEGNIIYVNDAETRLTGKTRDELLSSKVDIYGEDPNYGATQKEILEKTLSDGLWRGEVVNFDKNGNRLILDCRTWIVRNKNGNPMALCGISTDITEKKLTEAKLFNEATRRKILMEQSKDGIVVLRHDGTVAESNRQFAEMLNRPFESMNQLTVFDWEYLHSKEQTWEMLKSVDEHGHHFESQHRRADGSVYDVEISTNASWFNDEKLIFCVCRDITERKKAEKELIKQNENIAFLAESALSFVKISDFTDFYSYLGKGMQKLNPESYIMVFSVDYRKKKLTTQVLQGQPEIFNQISKMLGYNLVGKQYDITSPVLETGDGKIVKITQGLYDFTLGNVPKAICFALEKLFDISNLYGIAIGVDGAIVASVGIIFRNNKDISDIETIEAFIKQASIAYQRIMSEKALRESEERFKMLFEKAPIGYQSLDENGYFIEVNETWLSLLGYEKQEVIGKWFGSFLTPEHAEGFKVRFPIFKAQGWIHSEFNMVRKDGSEVYISFEGRIGKTSDGQFKQTHCTLTDITEQRRAEMALLESEERFKALHNASFGGIAIHDKGIVLECNIGLSEMFGYSYDELIGMNGLLLMAEQSREYVMANIKSGYEMPYEAFGLHKNGTEFPIRIEARNIPYKGKQVRVVEFRDISEQKKAEQLILESKNLLSKTQELAKIGGWEYDCLNKTMHWSDEVFRIHDLEILENQHLTEDIINESIACYHPKEREKIADAFEKCIKNAQPYNLEFKFTSAKGRKLWVETAGEPVIVDGKVAKVRGHIMDITDRKQAELNLIDSEQRVRRKLEALLAPEGDFSELELADIIDTEAIQKLMDHLYKITNMGIGIIDMNGKVVVATGWQRICTDFHRTNSVACQNCRESDLQLSNGIEQGKYKAYRCKNNLWDIATPVIIGGKHYGNIFFGQFSYTDENLDVETFRNQAKQYGFNEEEYLAALSEIPRFDRQQVDYLMAFYAKFGDLVASLSYSNLKLARSIEEKKKAEDELIRSELKYRNLFEKNNDGLSLFYITPEGPSKIIETNYAAATMLGYSREEILQFSPNDLEVNTNQDVVQNRIKTIFEKQAISFETQIRHKLGHYIYVNIDAILIEYSGKPAILNITRDVTESKQSKMVMEARLRLLDISESVSLSKILELTLAEVETLTQSEIGFYHFFDADSGIIKLNQWSEKTLLKCNSPKNLALHYSIENAGVWVECIHKRKPVIHNDLSNVAHKKGMIEGHPVVIRELTVPIIRNKKVVAVLGVGNKPTDYSPTDVEIVSQIADLAFEIVESKQAREWLVESEKNYRNLFENITQGFALHEIILDESGAPVDYRFITLNPGFEDLTGLKSQDLIGKRVKEVMPGTEQYWIDKYGNVALTGEPIHYQDFSKELDKYFEVWAFSPEKGKFAVVFSDVTSRVNAEAEARKLAAGIMQSPASVVITDKNGIIEFVNPRFTEVTGYTPEEAFGKNPRILKSGKQDNEFYRKMWETIKAGNNWRGEMINKKKNGDLYWEYAIITPVTNDRGEIMNFIAIKEDISDRKEKELLLALSEKRLREQNDELKSTNENLTKSNELILEMNQELVKAREKAEESDKLKTAFLANISHEIRTPLNGIMGFTKLLGKSNLTAEKYAHFLKIINASSQQLVNIVDDVIDIAKVEAGQIDLHEEKTCINQEMTRIHNLFKPQADEKHIELRTHFELQDSASTVFTDLGKFNQIVTNLVNNALKFTEFGYIEIGYFVKDTFLEIYVRDTGIGISPKHHQAVFERFRQVELEETRRYGGTGLGLSICKAYIEAMGGTIWVDSDLGHGSTFRFTIPFKPVIQFQQQAAASDDITLDLTGKTVLIAEDEETNMLFMRELFDDTNATILKAYNGLEAIEIVRKKTVHLVLMDIKMPEMDGLTATKHIKAEKPEIPIIATTAYALGGDKERCLNAGCDGYVSKPIDRDVLFEIIRQVIEG